MPKLIAITDTQGKVLGTVRSDSIQVAESGDSIQFDPIEGGEYKYREVEVADDLMEQSVERLHEEVAKKLEA
jgi:DNA gyrase inhibitor GyrI